MGCGQDVYVSRLRSIPINLETFWLLIHNFHISMSSVVVGVAHEPGPVAHRLVRAARHTTAAHGTPPCESLGPAHAA